VQHRGLASKQEVDIYQKIDMHYILMPRIGKVNIRDYGLSDRFLAHIPHMNHASDIHRLVGFPRGMRSGHSFEGIRDHWVRY
jgi:hypothetical protein